MTRCLRHASMCSLILVDAIVLTFVKNMWSIYSILCITKLSLKYVNIFKSGKILLWVFLMFSNVPFLQILVSKYFKTRNLWVFIYIYCSCIEALHAIAAEESPVLISDCLYENWPKFFFYRDYQIVLHPDDNQHNGNAKIILADSACET